MSSSSDNRQRVFLTLARTFSKEAGLTSEKQIRKTSWVWGRGHEKQQWLKWNNWTICNSSVCNEISQWTWRDQSELCRLQLRVSSTSSESLALRPACCRDKEHKQELLSLPALVPQTVYRYRGDKALLCWLQRAWLLKSLPVNGGKVINGGLHYIRRFVGACFFLIHIWKHRTFEMKILTRREEAFQGEKGGTETKGSMIRRFWSHVTKTSPRWE